MSPLNVHVEWWLHHPDGKIFKTKYNGRPRIGKIAQLLEAKGFGLSGDEPLSNQIRRVQMTGEAGEGESKQGGT